MKRIFAHSCHRCGYRWFTLHLQTACRKCGCHRRDTFKLVPYPNGQRRPGVELAIYAGIVVIGTLLVWVIRF